MDVSARFVRSYAPPLIMAERGWHLVTYDIRDPERLRRVARTIQGYGTRLQYSVFRCRLSDREIERLKWELSKICQPEDSLLFLPLCSACVNRVDQQGEHIHWSVSDPGYDII